MTNRAGAFGLLFRRVLALGVLALVGAAPACMAPSEKDTGPAVVFVGDSLAFETSQFLPTLVEPRAFVPFVFGGTAPCDWLGADLQLKSDSVLVISFIGNSGSPCMADGAGGFLQGQAILDKYRADVGVLIAAARSAQARVLLVGQPPRMDSEQGNEVVVGLNAIYTELAGVDGIGFVDAGALLENPDGTFATALPCLLNEPQCDPSGSNIVRSDDGLHLCPGNPPAPPELCHVYSSGAYRLAKAIADAVLSS